MKHMKIFEGVQDYEPEIMSKIDWKLLNYLVDKLTDFEDDGCDVLIRFGALTNRYYPTYFSINGVGENLELGNDFYHRDSLNKYKGEKSLYYTIIIYGKHGMGKNDTITPEKKTEITNKVGSKFDVMEGHPYTLFAFTMFLKPKS